MKILVTGCWHIGKMLSGYDWKKDFLKAVEKIVDISDDMDAMIHLGDLFDSGRPAPRHYALAAEVLDEIRCPMFLMKGNHDENPGLEPDALEPFTCFRFREEVKLVRSSTVIEFEGKTFAFIPFQNEAKIREESKEEFMTVQERVNVFLDQIKGGGLYKKVKGKKFSISLLCTHVDVNIFDYNANETSQRVGVILDKEKLMAFPFDVILGHYHKSAKFEPNIFVPGSILPFDFSEVGEKKQFLIVDV